MAFDGEPPESKIGSDGLVGRDLSFAGLRILGFCDYFTESSSGGAEKVAAEVYSRLIDLGAKVLVVTAVPGGHDDPEGVRGIPTIVVPGRDLSGIVKAQVTVARGLLKTARRAIDEFAPDVVHASSIHFQSSLTGAMLARRRGLPLVTTGHIGSVRELPAATRAATVSYENTIGRTMLRSSQRVIAVSESVASHMRNLGAKPDRIRVVYNGVDHERFKPGDRSQSRVEVVFVGRLIGNKGPSEVLTAFGGVADRDARLSFIGDGPLRGELEAESARQGLAARVRFVGHVDDVAPYLAAADVLVRPSRTEGQSLAILEAMASGVAVLASDIEPNRELLEHGRSGVLVAPGDNDGLSRALQDLIENADVRVRLAAAGRARALEHSWERCAVETGRVLAEAAGQEEK